jgi:hypothetical protein
MQNKPLRTFIISVAVAICALTARPTYASFTDASFDLLMSNSQAASSIYFGFLSLRGKSRVPTYYAYTYMRAARDYSWSAYSKALAAYTAEYSIYGFNAQSYSYYDWYYKSEASNNLFQAYIRPRAAATSRAISNGRLALENSAYATYYMGFASSGGIK